MADESRGRETGDADRGVQRRDGNGRRAIRNWAAPKSILYYEMLPYLANDPDHLDRKGFEVVNAEGKRISSGAVDWWSYGENIPYHVRQRPGKTNALGNIKFLFPNSHDIYMHDTPAKKLFAKSVRAFSHGCVRV